MVLICHQASGGGQALDPHCPFSGDACLEVGVFSPHLGYLQHQIQTTIISCQSIPSSLCQKRYTLTNTVTF